MKSKKILKCFDFECDISLVDREFLVSQSYETIKRIIISFKMRNIDNRKYDTSKYCEFDFYIANTHDEISIIIYFKRKVHVVNNLWTKIFIDIDILEFEVIIFDVT